MRNLLLRNTSLRLLLLAGFAGLSLTLALGHEGHHAECNETAINALKADIQAMGDGADLTPAEQFWIIKHGVKTTGMPAWGVTHKDELLWDVVAFVRKLPELTPEQYKTLVKNAPKHEELMQEMEMGGDHEHNGEHE